MWREEGDEAGNRPWKKVLFDVIFLADSPPGKAFDVALLVAILLSIVTVMLESVDSFRAAHGSLLRTVEWGFTLLFTAEYVLRMLCVKRPVRYATSFFGIVDFLAVAPTFLGLLVFSSHYFLVVRVLRVLRVFRILKLGRYVQAGDTIWQALSAARQKIAVFVVAVLSLVVIIGTLMYLIEGPEAGFTSIPTSVYWAIVTMTTVGYGDIAPQTVPGQMLASFVMILGYGIIAVPTGIMTVELGRAQRTGSRWTCPGCGARGHDRDALFCKICGVQLTRSVRDDVGW
ncbi:MAG: ion transporter [Thermoguttaceae bacterium]|jgi:voltage-gated potassium channel|nr:ion transporter [Thermoguttaceae bacterium]